MCLTVYLADSLVPGGGELGSMPQKMLKIKQLAARADTLTDEELEVRISQAQRHTQARTGTHRHTEAHRGTQRHTGTHLLDLPTKQWSRPQLAVHCLTSTQFLTPSAAPRVSSSLQGKVVLIVNVACK